MGGEIGLEHFDCQHFIAGWDDSGYRKSPVKKVDIPVLSAELDATRWSSEKIKAAFGEAEPLLDAYGEDFTKKPGAGEFLEILLTLLPNIETDTYSNQHPASMLGWDAVMCFAKEPQAAQKRIAELIGKLQKGFESLEDSAGKR